MRPIRFAVIAAALVTLSTMAAACPSFKGGSPPVGAFDLVVDGSVQFLEGAKIRIDIARTLKGPHFRKLVVSDAKSPDDEVWCPPRMPWTLFGYEPYTKDRPYRGRVFLTKYKNGLYLIHWFTPGKGR